MQDSGGQVDVAGDPPVGLAAWRAAAPVPAEPTLPTLGGLLAALVGTARAQEVGAALAALGGLRPAEPHAYLQFLAVDPAAQRRGHGRELLGRGLGRLAGTGEGAALETTDPANLPFYAAAGFVVRHEVTLAAGGPTVWAMWRAAA
ncbi:GNAT family N-acetyltransferase [Modestobacter italicus]|uniref:GNAT family N-acetyltransferase n=1 Tax=Modestobacter italicus (strain DSM 44449 / CECT 9708 / BC 501) TaxID=2732864 RepID=UPI001C984C60|nr:GNAT family N-acetyltransferase [Modestobacter italicus]